MVTLYNMLKEAINQYPKVYITLDTFYEWIESKDPELRNALNNPKHYQSLVQTIEKLCDENILQPVKSAKFDNRSLKRSYKIIREKFDFDEIKMEIMKLSPPIIIDYYLNHPEEYMNDKTTVKILDDFLQDKSPKELITVNERSWQLFKDEKFLKDPDKTGGKGERILRNTGLEYKDLFCYETYEPFFCFTKDHYKEKDPKCVLIIENKDTFWSFKRILFDDGLNLDPLTDTDVLIYGEGNKIINSFQFTCEYGLTEKDNYLYFGDLDPEGINILYTLKKRFPEYDIHVFTDCYRYMMDLSDMERLPKIRKNQRVNEDYLKLFTAQFDKDYAAFISLCMEKSLYIPQEALSYAILKGIIKGEQK